jgi:hypothetical protein
MMREVVLVCQPGSAGPVGCSAAAMKFLRPPASPKHDWPILPFIGSTSGGPLGACTTRGMTCSEAQAGFVLTRSSSQARTGSINPACIPPVLPDESQSAGVFTPLIPPIARRVWHRDSRVERGASTVTKYRPTSSPFVFRWRQQQLPPIEPCPKKRRRPHLSLAPRAFS